MLENIQKVDRKKWEKPVQDINEIRLQWNEKMKAYEEKGYSEKEALNIRAEQTKLADLDFLKGQNPPEPFTTSEEVSATFQVIL